MLAAKKVTARLIKEVAKEAQARQKVSEKQFCGCLVTVRTICACI